MINNMESRYKLSDKQFHRATSIIDRSGAAELIDDYYQQTKGSGGVPVTGISYTINAVLACALSLIMLNRTPSLAAILNTIGDLTPTQLGTVGMKGQDTTRIFGTPREQLQEYKRFTGWLTRRLAPLDPLPDQPARRISNAKHDAIFAARTAEEQADSEAANERLCTVVNVLIKGSILDPQPEGAAGDLVADESTFDLAGPSAGLGLRPEKNRGAAPSGRWYSRDKHTGSVTNTDRSGGKNGYSLGLTAITRVGTGDQLHAVAPVVVGAAIHHPTSGSVDALRVCLDHMRRNGLDTRPPGFTTWPRFTIDGGYSPKKDFPYLMLEQKYTGIFRYAINATLSEPSGNTDGPNIRPFGPIQYAGAFYCPAAEALLAGHGVPKTRDLLSKKAWHAHDDKLRSVLPFLMGTNSRPFEALRRGRPRLGAAPEKRYRVELVCPAVQGRVQCPLKPESLTQSRFGTPMATPNWSPDQRQCCANSTVKVTMTDAQLQKAQWGPPPGSWEHTLYLEAARSLTERVFAVMKSPHVTGITNMKWGSRRQPMIDITLALVIAATNDQIQRAHRRNRLRESSIDIRWRLLTHKLGYEPARTPPRT